jgi:hypothetical protein
MKLATFQLATGQRKTKEETWTATRQSGGAMRKKLRALEIKWALKRGEREGE